MTTIPSGLNAESGQAVTQAFQEWNSGQQQPAIERIRPFADRDEPWALALISWFLHQTGDPGWRNAIPYAEKAIRTGYPMAANYVIGNMMNDPNLRSQAPELMRLAASRGYQVDPIGWAQQVAQQGDGATAAEFLSAPYGPYPWHSPEGWDALVNHAQVTSENLREHARLASERQQRLGELVADVEVEAADTTNRIKTQTGSLFSLIEAATNRQAEAIFEDEATTLKNEEKSLWRSGIGIVSTAAVIAVLPLVLHYIGLGPEYQSGNLLAAHFTASASFAVVAGVMLARARGRDRARQRARDLTLALSTMFAYSAQIQDAAERSKFTYEMGRVVIESFLRADASSGSDETNSLLSALLQQRA
ncbi:hypothetical protein ACS3YM_06705 [Nocardia sp. N13]|uniref:hypothetical protein n=1 Tax=Nocardioides sp. N13(2025) TaxID=3453405 RepID=UPI003F75F41B